MLMHCDSLPYTADMSQKNPGAPTRPKTASATRKNPVVFTRPKTASTTRKNPVAPGPKRLVPSASKNPVAVTPQERAVTASASATAGDVDNPGNSLNVLSTAVVMSHSVRVSHFNVTNKYLNVLYTNTYEGNYTHPHINLNTLPTHKP